MCFVFFCECQVLASLKCKLWVVQWEKLSVERLYCFFFYFSGQSKVQRTSVEASSLPGNLWYPAPLCPRTQLWPNNLALFCYCLILEDVLINNIHPEYLKTSYNEKGSFTEKIWTSRGRQHDQNLGFGGNSRFSLTLTGLQGHHRVGQTHHYHLRILDKYYFHWIQSKGGFKINAFMILCIWTSGSNLYFVQSVGPK